jgi:hypothetical protein
VCRCKAQKGPSRRLRVPFRALPGMSRQGSFAHAKPGYTFLETGADMKIKYRETARGGLAVNIVEC